jgi:hypothetical protein
MREEIIKIHCEEYHTVKYKDSNPIDYREQPINNEIGWWDDDTVKVEDTSKKHGTRPLFLVDTIHSKNEEVFVENYGNPLSQVKKDYVMAVVEKDGDKISLKMFTGTKMRTKGVKYFRVKKNVDYITVNLKTGDVYTGYLHNFQKKRKATKQIRRNCFIGDPLTLIKNKLRNNLQLFGTTINDKSVSTVVNEVVNKFIELIDQGRYEGLSVDDRLFKFYLDKRGVKYPNNFGTYKQHLIGPSIRKKLKKNGNRLVDAFMDEKNLSGALLKKSLHECERINLDVYCYAKKVFGIDKLNQDKGTVLGLLESINHVNSPQNADSLIELISPSELDRYYQTFKEVFIYGNIDTYTLSDHVRMYCELRGFGVDVKWMADGSNKEGFHQEHLDWTDKLTHYRDGSYTRIYPDVLHQLLSKDIYGVKPVLLTTSKDYNEESSTQSNCVKSYVSRPTSIIVSLRNDENERATIEYQLRKIDEEVIINRVQSLGKRNQPLSSDWGGVLLSLDKIMLSYIKDKNFDVVKVIKENKMGMRFESNSMWNSWGSLDWEDKRINQGFIGLFY